MLKIRKFWTSPSTILLLLAITITFIVIRPFLLTVVSSAILAYVFYPVYHRLNAKFRKRSISALITVLIILVLIAIPTVFVLNLLSREVFQGYLLIRQFLSSHPLDTGILENAYFEDGVRRVANFLLEKISNTIFALPSAFLHVFIAMFLTYYFFKDGKQIALKLQKALPMRRKYKEKMIKRLEKVMYAVVYGNILVAIIQGVIATIGFFIFGVPSPILWGAVTIIFSLIPTLGVVVVWGPAAAIMGFLGYTASDSGMMFRALGLALYGFFIISTADNFLKPKIIGDSAKIHPAVVLLGVISGIAVFGFLGIIIGPVLLALATTLVEIADEQESVLLA